ncbi:MAG: hypothetical protein AB4352_12145 [Hormoscilla sp.]
MKRDDRINPESPLDKKLQRDRALAAKYEEVKDNDEQRQALERMVASLPDVPEEYERGSEFARGGTSVLYEMAGHPDFLIKAGGGRLSAEAKGLIEIEMAGIASVYAAQGDNEIIVRKIDGVGSKDVIGRSKQPQIDPEKASLVTDKTIADLWEIYEKLKSVPMNIGDF